MKTLVKICGLTNLIDAKSALTLGSDYIGFINILKSPRYLTIAEIEEIVASFEPQEKHKTILLSMDDSVTSIANTCLKLGIDIVQLYSHFDTNALTELKKYGIKIFKPIQIASEADLDLIASCADFYDLIVLDTKSLDPNQLGGTGQVFDWSLYNKAVDQYSCKFALSGGLNLDNIEKAIKLTKPFMVDVSSGLESKLGIKSYDKMRQFITSVKELSYL